MIALGHEVIAREIEVEDVGAATARERPDVTLIGVGESSQHAPDLIDKIVHAAACPVIVLLHPPIRVSSRRRRNVASSRTSATPPSTTGGALSISCFAASRSTASLRGRLGRRALTERARGILMERNSIEEDSAFAMLREHSRTGDRKLIDVAAAVVDGRRLLLRRLQPLDSSR